MKNLLTASLLLLMVSCISSCGNESSQQANKEEIQNQVSSDPIKSSSENKLDQIANNSEISEVAKDETPVNSKEESKTDTEPHVNGSFTGAKKPTKTKTNSANPPKDAAAAVPVKTTIEETIKTEATKNKPEPTRPNTESKAKPPVKSEDKPAIAPLPLAPAKPNHAAWDALLTKHVSSTGKVNYKGMKKDIANLKGYLKSLEENTIQPNWSVNKKMAYWINAYNAFTIKMIVDNYPVASITDLEGGKPWDKKWIKLGSKTYSLNNIENDILRPTYKDARIHFAVNCAAKSCPPLLNRAWTATNLKSNFEKQAKAFINNSTFNKVGKKEIEISKIFEWYAVDFGDIVDYINIYSNTKAKSNVKVKYMEYDWSLNE